MADPLDDYDWDGVADGLSNIMSDFYPDILKLAYTEADALLPVRVAFDLANPRVKDVIGELAKKIRNVSDTVRDDARRVVSDGLDRGDSIGSIAKALRQYGVTDSKSRSDMIARTETATAYSRGSLLAYGDAGVKRKKWLAEDDAPDSECQIDGEIVDLDESFSNGLDSPPVHPNCRCAVAPVIGDE